MKFLWTLGCLLVAFDMAFVAVGGRPSTLLGEDWVWLSWLPCLGWLGAAYSAAKADAKWF